MKRWKKSRFFNVVQLPLKWVGIGILGLYLSNLLSIAASFRLHPLFSDNMVLQRDHPIRIWGWADGDLPILVEINRQQVQALPVKGQWEAIFNPMGAGGPFTITIQRANETIVLTNVYVGDVWVCSGQSNMEWPLWNTAEGEEAIRGATNSLIRIFKVPRNRAERPQNEITGNWQICSPEAVRDFSAVGYHFGIALYSKLNIPIGLIQAAWGGSPIEVWMPRELLLQDPDYRKYVINWYSRIWKDYQTALEKWQQEAERIKKEGGKVQAAPNRPWQPSELYNGMIAPLIQFPIRGVIWYQGESNADRAWLYRRQFPDMIEAWRKAWGGKEFTFLAVQLAPWDKNRKRSLEEITAQPGESDWAELREAQVLATKIVPKVGIVVITDVGDKDDIHPRLKKVVGERLALAARVIEYGEDIDGLSPIYKEAIFQADKVIIRFDNLKSNLVVEGDQPIGFAISGPDKKWRWANARVENDQVIVWHPEVPNPIAVRYGWADYPVVNVYSASKLPVSPFRTDKWPMITAPKN